IAVPWLGSVIYPWPYFGSFVAAARSQQVSPYLLAAVAHVESRFDPLAVSHTGAVGVMQVEPATGSYLGHFPVPAADAHLRQPAQSVAIGARYLHLLEHEFGALDAALAAYNGGDATVRAWMRAGTWRQGRPISEIPYPETRLFVERVLRDMAAY
ncbi:lytic transglycosylase, catalytic, partial [mine drainage metagenome]